VIAALAACGRAGLLALLGLLAFAGGPGVAMATPSLDNCTGFIEPVAGQIPAQTVVIPSPGVWCLRADWIVTGGGYGWLVDVDQVSDVTIDCKGFRIEDTTGDGSAIIVRGGERITVRNCTFRGFYFGAIDDSWFTDRPTAFLVEDNVFVGVRAPITLRNPGAIVRRNRLVDSIAEGMVLVDPAAVEDNLIDGVVAEGYAGAVGIRLYEAQGSRVRGNVIRGLRLAPGISEVLQAGIVSVYQGAVPAGSAMRAEDNVLAGNGGPEQIAFYCVQPSLRYSDNVIGGFATATVGCIDAGDNDVSP
jgi:hypothetical protein